MSLETVVEDIRKEARAQADEIREAAAEDAEEIIAAAEAEADEIIAEREDAVADRIEREREQALSSAKLEAKQARLAARRDLLAELRSAVEERIRELEGERRETLTRALLADAVAEFPDDSPLAVRGSPQDEELLEELTDEYENAEYDGTIDCLGGVEVGSEASRVTIDNTFDAVLDEMWDDQLKELSTQLFESEQ